MKQTIIDLLLSTNRPGMDKLIQYMEENGFFTAPCSTQYHLAKDGGLAEHSLNVYHYANAIAFSWAPELANESLIIVSLLHDLGKMGQFGKANYVENILKSGKRSDSKPFASNSELLYVDHEIRSIHIAGHFIELTEEESFAILYHNGMYGNLKYALQNNETPLQMILHSADMWCSRVVEKEQEGEE